MRRLVEIAPGGVCSSFGACREEIRVGIVSPGSLHVGSEKSYPNFGGFRGAATGALGSQAKGRA
jgi:hypothetical protein